ncbi:hypothetical protein scyTo_0016951 [Scyliorhinus torazame]|uniref:Multidrug and toxin extrusion protein n=1 Tax=Scyliorhinus torazame TaxID=75743 RepID=A0A401Q212_SCYTO|nr:hypothetical protein [Scyliorhinus torazame]
MTDLMQVASSTAPQTPGTCGNLFLRKIRRILPGNFWQEAKDLTRLAGPVFLAQLMILLLNVVSTIFCGHLGKVELDAVSLATAMVNVSGISVGAGLSIACDTLISQTFGSKNLKRIGVILQRGILILMIACFPCWAIFINTENILLAFKQSPEVAKLTSTYVMIFVPALPAVFLYQLEMRYLQNQGITMPQILTGFIANIFNALVNYLLLNVLALGVQGSAAANVVSQYCQTSLLFGYIRWRKLHVKTWEGIISEVQLGAQCVLYQILSIVYMAPLGFSVAAAVRVGTALGAGNPEKAKNSAKVALWCIVLRGAGMQRLGAIGNLVGFYLIGFPIGISLMFAAKLGIIGFWYGIIICVFCQFTFYQIVICRMNWNEASNQALINAGVKKDVGPSHSTSGGQTENISTGAHPGNIAVIEVGPVENNVGPEHLRRESFAPKTSVCEILTVKQLIIRRGLAFLSGPLILAIGLLLKNM